MEPSSSPTQGTQVGADRRADILEAAAQEFAEHGFEGARTAAVARAAGVTQPLVHYHFKNKQGLWEAVIAELFSRLGEVVEGVLGDLRDLDPLSRLKVLTRRFLSFTVEHPELCRLVSWESAQRGPRLRALADRLRPIVERTCAAIAGLQECGLLKRQRPELLLLLVTGAAGHLAMIPALARELFAVEADDADLVEAYADSLIETAFHGACA